MDEDKIRPDWRRLSVTVTVLLVVTAVGSVIGYLAFNSSSPDLDRSEAPQWIVAIASVLTLAAAVVAASFAAATVNIELRRDKIRDEDRQAAQATQVAAWALYDEPTVQLLTERYWSDGLLFENTPYVSAQILNASSSPVVDVDVIVQVVVTDPAWPDDEERGPFEFGRGRLAVLPPTERDGRSMRVERENAFQGLYLRNNHGDSPLILVRIDLVFTDSANRRWVRDSKGLKRHEATA